MLRLKSSVVMMGALLALGSGMTMGAEPETQKQIDDLKAAIPKFAIPMREVGDRFQDMCFAVNGGNWALAAYMSKYMNGAMNPARLTKPDEYKVWQGFYEKPLPRQTRPSWRRTPRRSTPRTRQSSTTATDAMLRWATDLSRS